MSYPYMVPVIRKDGKPAMATDTYSPSILLQVVGGEYNGKRGSWLGLTLDVPDLFDNREYADYDTGEIRPA